MGFRADRRGSCRLVKARTGASAVLTTDYETTAWLRFYAARSQSDRRWMNLSAIPMRPAGAALARGRLLYLVEREARPASPGAAIFCTVRGLPPSFDPRRGEAKPSRAIRVWQLADAAEARYRGKMP